MPKSLIGTVTSDKRDKTITVSIVSRETHPLYRKQYSKTRKYTAHDEKNDAHLGDRVEIVECRPYSKTKTYRLSKIVERSHGSVALKENVTEVEMPEKIGADAEAKKAVETEAAAAAEKAVEDAAETAKGAEINAAESAEGEEE